MELTPDFFQGKLVKLTGIREEDTDMILRWGEDADYLRNVDTDIALPFQRSRIEQEGAPNPNEVYFRLRTVADDELIGFVAIHSIEWNNGAGKLAIGLGEARNRSKGYGTDALHLILRYAFHELNLNRVGLNVIEYNPGAIRAYEKAGFRLEGREREAVRRDGRRYDLIIMGILYEEWLAAQEKN